MSNRVNGCHSLHISGHLLHILEALHLDHPGQVLEDRVEGQVQLVEALFQLIQLLNLKDTKSIYFCNCKCCLIVFLKFDAGISLLSADYRTVKQHTT